MKSKKATKIEKQKTIRTKGRDFRLGALIEEEYYEAIKTFLLDVLEKEKSILAKDLIVKCHDQFYPQFGDNTGWFLFNVKVDLEERGLIIHRDPTHKRMYAMVSKARKIR